MQAPGDPVTDEHRDFLRTHSRVFLVVRGPGERPIGYPMTGRVVDGGLEFSTYRKSAKVGHVGRDGRVCCVAVPMDPAAEDRVLTVWGDAQIRDDLCERWTKAADGLVGLTVSAEVRRKIESGMATGKRTVVRVELGSARFTPRARG